jgi:hypothetical protein
MRETGNTTKCQARESTNGRTVDATKVGSKTITDKDLESFVGLTARSMKETGLWVNRTGRGSSEHLMDARKREYGRMESK